MTARKSIEVIRKEFASRGCKLLDDEYKNNHTPIKFRCSCGSISTTTYKVFNRGGKCMNCNGKPRCPENYIREQIESEGYKWISGEYYNAFTLLILKCSQQHEYQSHWNNFQQGRRCPKCANKNRGRFRRKNIDEVREIFKQKGCELLEDNYNTNKS